MVRRPRGPRLVVVPPNAAIAIFRAFTCCAALSRSAFNCAIMSMCSSPGEDCSKIELCCSLHQREQHSQSIVKRLAFRCAEGLLPYSVLMNCLTRDFHSFRKFGEIEFDDSSVVQLLPGGVGHKQPSCEGARKARWNSPDVAPQRQLL